MRLLSLLRQRLTQLRDLGRMPRLIEAQLLLEGRHVSELLGNIKKIKSLRDVEFRVFSQFGDDGIIQWLIRQLEIQNQTFVEFGVADYFESNTRFLLMNNNWSGFIMDGSKEKVAQIRNANYYWKYSLTAQCAFIDQENINTLLEAIPFDADIGLLHIDLDGMDFWIWKALNRVTPAIVILEYNSVFGINRAITVPYAPDFQRTKAHYSNLYWGASLRALCELSNQKGYAFIGCNSAGNNAYFVRRDKLNDSVKETALKDGFVESKLRESKDKSGDFTHVGGPERIAIIRGMPVYNVITDEVEAL